MADGDPADEDASWLAEEAYIESYGVPRQDSYTCLSCGKTAYPTDGGVDILDPEAAHIQHLDDEDDAIIVCWECLQTDDWEERARKRRAEQESSDFPKESWTGVLTQRLRAVLRSVPYLESSDTKDDSAAKEAESVFADSSKNRSEVEKLEWKLEQEREWSSYLEQELQAKDDRLVEVEQELHRLRQEIDSDVDGLGESTIAPHSELLSTLFDVRDSLARATAAADADSKFRDGLVRIDQQLVDALEREGIEQIQTNGKVNPHRHKVVETVSTPDHPPGTILEEYQAGYKRGGVILRPAQVAVAANPGEDAEHRSDDEDAGDDRA